MVSFKALLELPGKRVYAVVIEVVVVSDIEGRAGARVIAQQKLSGKIIPE